MYLLHQQSIAARTTLLLPGDAYEFHGKTLSVTTKPYRSLQDILDLVAKESPDLVCLFSGYILTTQQLLSSGELRALISELRQHGCQLVTSDPYLGTYRSSMIAASNSETLGRQAGPIVRFFRVQLLLRHVRKVMKSLQGIKHLIAVPKIPTEENGLDYVSFFNPLYFREPDELKQISSTVSGFSDIASSRTRWLFVLARFDLEYQLHIHGERRFVEIVVRKLRETLENERHPVLIAPADLINAVSPYFDSDARVSLLPGCSFDEFEKRLLDAEIVFYWQIFSTSTFLRLLHGLPVYCFDAGHSAHLSESFHKKCLAQYYLVAPPALLSIDEPLDKSRLMEPNGSFIASAELFRKKLSVLPTPTEMIDSLFSEY